MKDAFLLAIDQGTTSSRAMLFNKDGSAAYTAQQEFAQHYPDDGWVEHDAEEIWATTRAVTREALTHAGKSGRDVIGVGITNQRETTVVWDRKTGAPIHNAIVWQDRRTAPVCAQLTQAGHEQEVTARTGLLLDPYFSATKIAWLLDNVPGARVRAERGELAFGTMDTFLIWRLTGGECHLTDATNASRTSLFNIHTQTWDPVLLEMFQVPPALLPEVRDCADDFGLTREDVVGRSLPIAGVAGDQQAALIGQACFEPGMLKSTYGTGCFVILNTGGEAIQSRNRLLTTVGYRLAGRTTYAIEGSIFVAGAAVQWLRDGLGLVSSAPESEALAAGLDNNAGVYLVPAFTGLGAPHWDPDARGAIFGLTRDTGVAHVVRATLESVCYQSADLFAAMHSDGVEPARLRVDGGMVNNNWLCGFLADILNVPVERPAQVETTALGAAMLAGLQLGMFASLDEVAANWRAQSQFEVSMEASTRQALLTGWHGALKRVKTTGT